MKAIIQSYSPKEVERIARGEQTIKVCKTAPKETPFKVYMYKKPYAGGSKIINEVLNGVYSGGKVVGEFVCDKVDEYEANDRGWYIYPQDEVCMWADEIAGYGKGKPLRGLHITAAKFYDEPKALSEFKKYNRTCKFSDLGYAIPDCKTCRDCNLTRPPQSWQYVEPLDK